MDQSTARKPQPKSSPSEGKVDLNIVKSHSISKTETEELRADVIRNDDGSMLWIDIRRFANGKPTKRGVCLTLTEFIILQNWIDNRREGYIDGKRRLALTRIWTKYRISLQKSKKMSEIFLSGEELDALKAYMTTIIKFMEDYIASALDGNYRNLVYNMRITTRRWDAWGGVDEVDNIKI